METAMLRELHKVTGLRKVIGLEIRSLAQLQAR
jgi:hypothetical protein